MFNYAFSKSGRKSPHTPAPAQSIRRPTHQSPTHAPAPTMTSASDLQIQRRAKDDDARSVVDVIENLLTTKLNQAKETVMSRDQHIRELIGALEEEQAISAAKQEDAERTAKELDHLKKEWIEDKKQSGLKTEEERKAHDVQIAELKKEIGAGRQLFEELQSRAQDLQETAQSSQNDVRVAEDMLLGLDSSLAEKDFEIDALSRQLGQHQRHTKGISQALTVATAANQDKDEMIRRLQAQVDAYLKELEAVETSESDLKLRLNVAKSKLQVKDAKLSESCIALDKANDKIVSLERNVQTLAKKRDDALEDAQKQNKWSTTVYNIYQKEKKGAEALIQRLKKAEKQASALDRRFKHFQAGLRMSDRNVHSLEQVKAQAQQKEPEQEDDLTVDRDFDPEEADAQIGITKESRTAHGVEEADNHNETEESNSSILSNIIVTPKGPPLDGPTKDTNTTTSALQIPRPKKQATKLRGPTAEKAATATPSSKRPSSRKRTPQREDATADKIISTAPTVKNPNSKRNASQLGDGEPKTTQANSRPKKRIRSEASKVTDESKTHEMLKRPTGTEGNSARRSQRVKKAK